jgi:hypothetical protein
LLYLRKLISAIITGALFTTVAAHAQNKSSLDIELWNLMPQQAMKEHTRGNYGSSNSSAEPKYAPTIPIT